MSPTTRFVVLLSCACMLVGLLVGAAIMRHTNDGWRGVLTVCAVLALSTLGTVLRRSR